MRYLSTFLILALMLVVSPALSAKRVALVIGNNDYATLPKLNNAKKDAQGMAAKLRDLGFDVILRVNASRREMGRTLADFEHRIASADVALVFYAGHGIQADGKNYLIPSDARIEIEEDLRFESIDAQEFFLTMKRAGTSLNIVIMDACRDNPLPRRTRSAIRGLVISPVPAGIKGTAIVYSAAPGQTAQDGPLGGHGVFTGALLKVLDEPGLKLEDVFKKTAIIVASITRGKQDPWINSSIKGDFYFKSSSPAISRPMPPTTSSGAGSNEGIFWNSIKDSNNKDNFLAYLGQFPKGTFVKLARIKLNRLKGNQATTLTPPNIVIEEVDATYVAVKTVNLRSQPSAQSKKVGQIKVDTGLSVTGKIKNEKWYRVIHGGNTAFVYAPMLKVINEMELEAWGRVKDSGVSDEFEGFLKAHPSGHFSEKAKKLLMAFKISKPIITARPPELRTYYISPVKYKGNKVPNAEDIIHRSLRNIPKSNIVRGGSIAPSDTIVTAVVMKLRPIKVKNPNYASSMAGAAIMKGLFGNIGSAISAGITSHEIVIDIEIMLIAKNMTSTTSLTDTGRAYVKVSDYDTPDQAVSQALNLAFEDGSKRIFTRIMGGVPEVWKQPKIYQDRKDSDNTDFIDPLDDDGG
jgi:hypothetical protein